MRASRPRGAARTWRWRAWPAARRWSWRGAVLADRGIERAAMAREPLARLMDFLGGHPLSLYLVLPHLARHTPDELIAEFDTLLPGFTAGAAKERNESLTVSLEFSLRRLTPAARAALPDLAVFAGLAMEDDLLEVTELDPALWAAARAELVGAGLATLEEIPGAQFPYVRFHPTLLPYLRTLLTDERRAALEERYWQRYYALADYFYREDNKNPHFIRALVQRDLPNLRRGLDLALQRAAARPDDPAALEAAADFADSVARFLDNFGLRRERERLGARVDALTAAPRPRRRPDPGRVPGPLTASRALLSAGRAREAEAVCRELLARFPTEPTSPPPLSSGEGSSAATAPPNRGGVGAEGGAWAYERAVTLGLLGRALAPRAAPPTPPSATGRSWPALARQEQTATVQREAGVTHTDLADALRDLGRYAEARAEYEAA